MAIYEIWENVTRLRAECIAKRTEDEIDERFRDMQVGATRDALDGKRIEEIGHHFVVRVS